MKALGTFYELMQPLDSEMPAFAWNNDIVAQGLF